MRASHQIASHGGAADGITCARISKNAARLIEDVSEVRALWKEDAHARYFPTEKDRANAGFIEVRIERMELWIRGVTPEPFGLHATILQRNPKGAWYWAT